MWNCLDLGQNGYTTAALSLTTPMSRLGHMSFLRPTGESPPNHPMFDNFLKLSLIILLHMQCSVTLLSTCRWVNHGGRSNMRRGCFSAAGQSWLDYCSFPDRRLLRTRDWGRDSSFMQPELQRNGLNQILLTRMEARSKFGPKFSWELLFCNEKRIIHWQTPWVQWRTIFQSVDSDKEICSLQTFNWKLCIVWFRFTILHCSVFVSCKIHECWLQCCQILKKHCVGWSATPFPPPTPGTHHLGSYLHHRNCSWLHFLKHCSLHLC